MNPPELEALAGLVVDLPWETRQVLAEAAMTSGALDHRTDFHRTAIAVWLRIVLMVGDDGDTPAPRDEQVGTLAEVLEGIGRHEDIDLADDVFGLIAAENVA